MRSLLGLVAALSFHAACATDFQANKDHCKAGEFRPVNPLTGGNWVIVISKSSDTFDQT
ncbi:MAG: hypothetical protein WBX25_32650 [Rhodomicrobium sp.]